MTLNRVLLGVIGLAAAAAVASMIIIALAPWIIGGCAVWLVWRVVLKPALLDEPPTDTEIIIQPKGTSRSFRS